MADSSISIQDVRDQNSKNHRLLIPKISQFPNSKIPKFNSSVPAGFPSPATDYMEEDIDLNKALIKNPASTFLIKVEGDSMTGACIISSSYLVIDKSIKPKHGHIVVAVINGEFTVKRLIKTSTGVFLSPENPHYKPIKVTEEMEMQIWGVVTYIINNAMEV